MIQTSDRRPHTPECLYTCVLAVVPTNCNGVLRGLRRAGRPAAAAAMLLLIVSTQDARAGETASRFPTIARTNAAIAEASGRFAIPANWIRAVIAVESAGQASVVSPKGAMGLMQIMPETWFDLRQRYHLGADPFDVHDNVLAGSAFLRELFDRFGPQGFLTAYNAGVRRYLAYLTEGRPLPDETRLYLTRIAAQLGSAGIGQIVKAPAIVPDWRTAPLFSATPQTSGNGIWAGAKVGIPAANAPPPASISAGMPDAIPSRFAPQSGGLFAALVPAVTP